MKHNDFITAGVLFAVTTAAYLPAVRGGFIWDDDAYVTDNQTLRTADGLRRIWFEIGATDQYYPLVFTTFWMECRLWGLHPAGYHLVNVLVHAASAVLLWRILRGLDVPGALLGALIFALHPVNVESVAWITERKNVLSGVFYLAAGAMLIRFFGLRTDADGTDHRIRHYTAGLLLFALALASKTVTATLPAALLILLAWRRGRVAPREAIATAPFFVLGAASGALTVWIETHHVGTKYVDWDLNGADRLLIAGRALWFYLGKLVWPARLTFIYPRWEIDAAAPWQWLFPVGWAALLAVLIMLRRRIGRGPAAAAIFFTVTLLPALGFIDIYPMRFSFVADHFQYLAAIGPIALSAVLLSRAVPVRRLAFLVPVALAVLTWRQCSVYRNGETLWRDTLSKNPNAWMAHGNLGAELARQGRYDEAIEHFHRGLQLKPDAPQVYCYLGKALYQSGRMEEAVAAYRRAVAQSPEYVDALNNLGVALMSLGDAAGAIDAYRRVLERDADNPDALCNLGNAVLQRGDAAEAERLYRRAIEARPGFTLAMVNLAETLSRRNETGEAIEWLQRVVALNPGFGAAHAKLAVLLAEKNQLDQAEAHLREALRLDATDANARLNLALMLLRKGRQAEAVEILREARRLAPDSAEIRRRLRQAEEMQESAER